MKALVRFVLCMLAFGSVAEHTIYAKDYLVQLRGVIDVEGLRAALLEFDSNVHSPVPERRAFTRLLHEGDIWQPEVGRSPRLELLQVDAPRMKINLSEDGVENTYSIPSGPLSWPGTNRLAFASASLADAIDLLSLLTDRIVLFHPKNDAMAPQLQCHWTNSLTTKAEAAEALESAFRSRDAAPLPMGKDFLLLVPNASTNAIARAWVSPLAGPAEVPPFAARTIAEGVAKYGELTGRTRKAGQELSEARFYLRTLKPVSKADAIYSIKTILSWDGFRVIDGGDSTFTLQSSDAERSNP